MLDDNTGTFGGTNTTNGIWFFIDPDGRVTDGTTNGPGKSIQFWLYFNGRITDEGSLAPGTTNANAPRSANPAYVPSWFSW